MIKNILYLFILFLTLVSCDFFNKKETAKEITPIIQSKDTVQKIKIKDSIIPKKVHLKVPVPINPIIIEHTDPVLNLSEEKIKKNRIISPNI